MEVYVSSCSSQRKSICSSYSTKALIFSKPSLPSHERVLYAALAPSPQTSVILKSACRTWEDHLWAQISIVIEEKESTEMGKLGGFWEGGQNVTMAADDEEAEEEEWENEVIGALEGLESVGVTEG